jgi:hypothetical protein
MMHRFRLLGFYVAGIVGMVGLTIGAVSMRRIADDHGARAASGNETVAPTTVKAEPSRFSHAVSYFAIDIKDLDRQHSISKSPDRASEGIISPVGR